MESSSKLTDLLAAPPTNYGAITVVEPRRDKRQEDEQVTTTTTTSSSSRGHCHFRLLLYVLIFLAGSISYALRVSLSQALVAMVNRTSHHASRDVSNDTDEVCAHDAFINATSDDVTMGEKFDWDRNAQGAVLAAFYYGYALIQVNYRRKFIQSGPKTEQ